MNYPGLLWLPNDPTVIATVGHAFTIGIDVVVAGLPFDPPETLIIDATIEVPIRH